MGNLQKQVATLEGIARLYNQLKEYKERYGHLYVSPFPPYDTLFEKIKFLRKNKKEISPDLKLRFKELGFDWSLKVNEARWLYFYNELNNFFKSNNHCNVPVDYQGGKLNSWIARQRANENKLKQWQIDLLNKICFEFSHDIEEQRENDWQENYQKLQEFYREYGTSLVPSTYSDQKLARWVINQRYSKSKLSKEQKDLLKKVEFLYKDEMNGLKNYRWYYNFDKLASFKAKYGHVDVPATYQNKSLANWVRAQRSCKQKLSSDKKKALKEIGFKFSDDLNAEREKAWLTFATKVKSYLKEQGNLKGIDSGLRKWWYKQKDKKNLKNWQKVIVTEIMDLLQES